jgi:hypothetical protein
MPVRISRCDTADSLACEKPRSKCTSVVSFALNGAAGYITPKYMLTKRQQEITRGAIRELEVAWKQWPIQRQQIA